MLTHLVIPTKDRPKLLDRCIRSFRALWPSVTVVVADESAGDESRLVAHGLGAVYIGSRERDSLLDRLCADADVPRDLLDWGTRGLGGTRNLLQLAMVGRVYASADDDTVGTFYAHGDPTEAPMLCAVHDPTRMHFYRCLDNLPAARQLDPWPALMSLVEHGASVAQCGQLGDSGMAGPMGNGDRYERARVDRIVRRHVDAPTLTTGGHLMLHCAAFDGTRVLPPFYPSGRGEDAMFAACLGALGQWVGHAPLAVTHLPEDSDARGRTPREYRPHDALWEWLCAVPAHVSLGSLGAAIAASGLAPELARFGELVGVWGRVVDAAAWSAHARGM